MRIWPFVTLLLAALGLTLGATHVLELFPGVTTEADMRAVVASTLFQRFGPVGIIVQFAALIAALAMTLQERGRRGFQPTVLGTLALAASLVMTLVVVTPVAAEWMRTSRFAPENIPSAYLQLHSRWASGHLAAFLLWLAGFGLLLVSALRDYPAVRPRPRHA